MHSISSPGSNPISARCAWHVRERSLGMRTWRAAAVASTIPSSKRALRWVPPPRSSSLSSLVLTHFFPSHLPDLPYPHSFFLLLSGHLHSHIWCLLQGHPGQQVASEGQCKQVRPGVSLTLSSHAPARHVSPGLLLNEAPLPLSLSSENNKPTTSKTTFHLELPVKYAINMVISRCELWLSYKPSISPCSPDCSLRDGYLKYPLILHMGILVTSHIFMP